jgi:Cys-tRNA(Pro)/Cys-tRNA(Cys) deacylase
MAKKTNAARCLDNLGLAYELISYKPGPEFKAAEAAVLLGVPPEIVYKTLLLRGDRQGLLEACLPSHCELDLKALAAASGNKKVTMTTVKELTILTGYLRGGCSPLGGLKDYPVYLAKEMFDYPQIYVNAGARGLLFLLDPQDLQKATNGRLADISKPQITVL